MNITTRYFLLLKFPKKKKAEIIDKKQQASLEKSRKNYEENQRKIREQLSFAQNIGQQFGEAFAENAYRLRNIPG